MARSLPAAFQTQMAKATGAYPRRVLEIDHGGTIGTVYYAGTALQLDVSTTAEARVVEWGEQTITAEPGRVAGYGTRSLRLADADGVLRTRWDSERPGIQGRRARIWLWFDGTTWPDDAAVEFDGAVGQEASWQAGDGTWHLQLDGTEAATDDLTLGERLTRHNFPETACAGTEGKILPVAYGDLVRRIPAVLIDKPGFGYLAATCNVPDATLTLNATAAELGFTSGTTISLVVGTGGHSEVITGSFAGPDTAVFNITGRGSVLAEGNLSGGSYNPSPYGVLRYGVIPHDDLPGGSSEGHKGGAVILLFHPTRSRWEAYQVTSWINTGTGFAAVALDSSWESHFDAAYKLLRIAALPVWPVGCPVAEVAPWVFAVNHLPSRGVDRVEARADVRGTGSEGQNRSVWYRYNAAYYTVNLDNKTYNTLLGRGAEDPGITTVATNSPPWFYGFGEETIYVSLRATTDDDTTTGDPIVNPIRVIQSLLTNPALGNVDSARINTSSFDAAAAAVTELCAFALLEERKLHEVCAELAQQCGCLYFWDQGQAHVVKLPTGTGTSVWTADQSKIARAGENGPPLVSYTALPSRELVTELTAKWQLACKGPQVYIARRSVDAVAEIGRKTREFHCWAYQYASSVATATEHRLLWWLNRQRRVTFTTFLPAYHLQPGDVITVQLSDGTTTYFGPYVGVVVSIKQVPGDARHGRMETLEVSMLVNLWSYEVEAIPAGPDACLQDEPPQEFANTLLEPPGVVTDGVSYGLGAQRLVETARLSLPFTPEAGEGGGGGFFGRTTSTLPQGAQPPDTFVERHRGPAYGLDPEPTQAEVHYAQVEIPPGTWVWCQEEEEIVYVAPWVCAEPPPSP